MLLVADLSEFRWSVDEPAQCTHGASGSIFQVLLKRPSGFVRRFQCVPAGKLL